MNEAEFKTFFDTTSSKIWELRLQALADRKNPEATSKLKMQEGILIQTLVMQSQQIEAYTL